MLKSNGPRIEIGGTSAKTFFLWLKELFILKMLISVRNIFREKLILTKVSNNSQ